MIRMDLDKLAFSPADLTSLPTYNCIASYGGLDRMETALRTDILLGRLAAALTFG